MAPASCTSKSLDGSRRWCIFVLRQFRRNAPYDVTMLRTETEETLYHLLDKRSDALRAQHAEELWLAVLSAKANPVTMGTRALFVHWSDEEPIQLVGDWTYWQPSAPMHRIVGTQLHYTVLEFPSDARLQYKLIVAGKWELDPANNRVVEEGFGLNNEFTMPDYRDRSFLTIGRPVPSGSLERLTLESSILPSQREIILYTPTIEPLHTKMNLLLVHDGEEAIRLGKFPRILDNLHALGLLEPTAACFLPPHNRNSEYADSDTYVTFCTEELLPVVIRWYAERGITVGAERKETAVMGASLGGLLATKTALLYPDTFGAVLAQSPSYWWNRGEIFRTPALRNAAKLHVVIQTGTICDARELSSLMARRLRMVGAHVSYFEYSQSHTWGNWRSTFAEGIQALYSPKSHSSLTS
jgi:enterochelin esterase-like enzyme